MKLEQVTPEEFPHENQIDIDPSHVPIFEAVEAMTYAKGPASEAKELKRRALGHGIDPVSLVLEYRQWRNTRQ